MFFNLHDVEVFVTVVVVMLKLSIFLEASNVAADVYAFVVVVVAY